MSRRETPSIVPALLKLRARGKPPFLVRNLRYVQACKDLARKRVWDLSWTEPDYRSAKGGRHLVLKVRPSRCVLAENVTSYLLNISKPLPRHKVGFAYKPYIAALRVTLHVRQRDGHVVSFSTRSVRVRVWPEEHQKIFMQCGYELEDFPVTETFDLSAVLPLLGTKAASLSLTVELWSSKMLAKSARVPVLLGEVLIWDFEKSRHGSAIPNAFVTVPLRFAHESDEKLPSELVARDAQATAVSFEDNVIQKFEYMGIEGGSTVDKNATKDMNKEDDGSEEMTAGSIVLGLTGGVEKAISKALEEDKPHISVQLKYKSPDVSWWDGIVRNDFICPWCHRNCHRYRALLAHFQIEHNEMKFAVQGGTPGDGDSKSADRMPFTLEFTVKRLDQVVGKDDEGVKRKKIDKNMRGSNSSKDPSERYNDYTYANPKRYGSYMMTMQHSVQKEVERSSRKDSGETGEDTISMRTSSIYHLEGEEFLSFVHKQLGSNCKVCFRQHNKEYNGQPDYCSEWCEIVDRKKQKESNRSLDTDGAGNVPLLSLATVPRARRINFKESMGHLRLYHVVSVHEANVDLLEEDDPDSEEEVDQTWRMDLSLEGVRHLHRVSPKEKALWLMWNKFAHEHYPLPSFYGERYSRYTLELFALLYSSQIKQFKLRLTFLGFLRAVHRHGIIDSVAIKSIVRCVDGKKRRRDIQVSARPELPHNALDMNGRRLGKARTVRPAPFRAVTQDPGR